MSGSAVVQRREEMGQAVRDALARRDALTFAMVDAMEGDAVADLGFAAGAVLQEASRIVAVIAAKQSRLSEAAGGSVGFARRRGFRSAQAMVEKQTGVSGPEAKRLIELGETLADAERAATAVTDGHDEADGGGGAAGAPTAPSGSAPADPAPDGSAPGDSAPGDALFPTHGGDSLGAADVPSRPRPAPSGLVFAHVAAASRQGRLGAEAATAITRMLRRVAERCDADDLVREEKNLVFAASHLSLFKLRQAVNRAEARLDADHLEELAEQRRERRFLTVGENADGMIRVNGQLDPENGAPLVALMGAMVNQHFRTNKRARDAAKAGRIVTIDERTPGQVCADAMGAFARHMASCDVEVLPHASAQVIVTMDYGTMLAAAKGDSVVGPAVDGLSSTPDAGELRRLMARAGLIPQVLGGGSCTLDFGHHKRSFSPAQRKALAARDGGCAKCSLPTSWDDCHHIIPVEFGGKTDLSNGVTLCVKCHHDIHREGWIIVATHSEVWFIPPAHLDPTRTPQPGGRRLFDATVVYGDHLPPVQDVIARTPIAATTAGDHRRRGRRPSGPPEGRSAASERESDVGTLLCAMDPGPRISMPVDDQPSARRRNPQRRRTRTRDRHDGSRARPPTSSQRRYGARPPDGVGAPDGAPPPDGARPPVAHDRGGNAKRRESRIAVRPWPTHTRLGKGLFAHAPP